MKNKNIFLSLLFCAFVVVSSAATLNLSLFIGCYYVGSGQMQPVLYNEGVCGSCFTQVDTILVELHDSLNPLTVVASFKGMLMVDGTVACTFPNSVVGNSYYVAVKHRSTVQTWSASPVLMNNTTSYDFTTAPSQAYGNNMILVSTSPIIFAFYCGDINQDGNIDQIDFEPLDFGINHGLFGYNISDLNGDGNTDLLDFPILDASICPGIYTHHP